MRHPNLDILTGRDPEATFPVRTFAAPCKDPAHTDCIAVVHYEQREYPGPFRLAWVSHAHQSAHVACRIGDATPECENATGDGGPDVYEWQPMCADCHHIFGHAEPYHHPSGVQMVRGQLMVHAAHPRAGEFATHPGIEVHDGDGYASCSRCGPQAAACDGCRDGFEAQAHA